MDRTGRTRPPPVRLVITPGALAILFGAIIAAILLRNLFVAGRRPVAWAVAAVVMAAAIEPLVSLLTRQMRRGVALIVVLVPLLAGTGMVVRAVYQDLDRSTSQLQEALPEAAASIERSDRLGDVARQLELRKRAQEAADRLKKPSSGVAGKAVSQGSTWLVSTILTIFALGWGPRFATAALDQFRDERRRERVARICSDAFTRSQVYVDLSLAQGVVVGVMSWVLFHLFGVPAPTPLAVLVGILGLVPVVGIIVGALPAVMLVAGFESFGRAGALLAIALVLQVVQLFVFRAIARRTLYVGPAVIVIAFLLGSDVYGLGGAVFGTAVAVFGVALLDARARDHGDDELVPDGDGGELVPDEVDPTTPASIPESESA